MIVYNQNHTISFSLFNEFPELLCVMSTRKLGDLSVGKKPLTNAMGLLELNHLSLKQLTVPKQVHETLVVCVGKSCGGSIISQADGLVTTINGLYLGVKAADCVPLFFYDPGRNICAVAHAGWKGTLGKIAAQVINEIKLLGGELRDIRVAIGPHIGGCCYNVSSERAYLFKDKFQSEYVAFQNGASWYLDLGLANKLILIQQGVEPNHIDAPVACTSCQNDLYFSYRKEGGYKTYGEMLGIIGVR